MGAPFFFPLPFTPNLRQFFLKYLSPWVLICVNIFQLARLQSDDITAVNNMRLLGGASDIKKSSTGAFSLKFDINKVNICMSVEILLLTLDVCF